MNNSFNNVHKSNYNNSDVECNNEFDNEYSGNKKNIRLESESDINSPLLNNNYGSFQFQSFNLFNEEIKNDINYYYKFLIIIGVFYILPSLEFVFFQSKDSSVDCYYNHLCKNDLAFIPAFNSIISNIFYIFYGVLFCIIVKKTFDNKNKNNGITFNGLDSSPALYYSLGLTLVFEGLCSATYHICPTKLNFQFDTTFMFVGALLMCITIYQKRNYAPFPFKIYSFIAFIVFLNILPLANLSNDYEAIYWGFIFIFLSYFMIFGSIYIYYGKEYDFEVSSIKMIISNVKKMKIKDIPKLLLLIFLNSFTLGMYIFASIYKPNFTDWFLGVLIINMLIYFIYYLILKIKNKEKINKIFYLWIVLDLAIISMSLIFFLKTSTNIFLSIEESNKLNHKCVLLGYFDYHDIWHILSSTGLFIFINIVYFIDKDLNHLVQDQIAMF